MQQQPIPMSIKALVAVIVAIELMLQASDLGIIGNPDARGKAFFYGAFWNSLNTGALPEIYPGQRVVMYVSHAFLHGGFVHMALNTVVLLALGTRLGNILGNGRILLLFFVSAAAGGLTFGLINQSPFPMIGASGAVFGFFGTWKYFEFVALRRIGADLSPIWKFIGTLVLINVLMAFSYGGSLAWEAHLGGFIAGWGMGALFVRQARA